MPLLYILKPEHFLRQARDEHRESTHKRTVSRSIVAGSAVSGYAFPAHLAKKLLGHRSVTALVEAAHREEQAMYMQRAEQSAATAQLRTSLIASTSTSSNSSSTATQSAKTKREKSVHPAVRSGRRQLFPQGDPAHPEVPQPPNYRSPKSFKDDLEAQQVRERERELGCRFFFFFALLTVPPSD